MKKLMIGLVTAALLPMAAPVMAKDICLQADWGAYYKFKGVKSLKASKAVKMVPLVGATNDGGIVPVEGSATVTPDGNVRYGVFVNTVMNGGNNFSIHITSADETMAGTGGYDNDGDMSQNGTMTFTAVDCKTITDLIP